jgi:sigma-E factor negative regulatory protein RseB
MSQHLSRLLAGVAHGTVVLGLLWGALPARAQEAGANPDPLVEAREARSWLMRIHDAGKKKNFQGTFVVSAGGTVSSSRIVHFYEGSNQFERIEAMDGEMRKVFRHNDVVHTLWPLSRVAVVEQRESINAFPALLQSRGDRIVEFYDVKPLGTDRVAGHEANVLGLRPKDAYRFGYRLWAERQSGLLLRADVLDEKEQVLESSAFSEVSIGVRPQLDAVVLPMKKLEGYRVQRPVMAPTDLEREGWFLRVQVPGFRHVSCVKRPVDNTQNAPADQQMLQAIYADGLTYVSVFVEPYNSSLHRREMVMALGATRTLMRRQGDWWITVMGDVPVNTLRSFAAGLERKK